MLFKPASGRLNFFFGKNAWILLQPDSGSTDTSHMLALRNACRHWGSRLAFPPEINVANFEEGQDATAYWTRQFPGLALLHYRKQQILIRDLAATYDPEKASQLLCRKLKLPLQGWGYLVWIGEGTTCYSLSIPSKPVTADWQGWISAFYNSENWTPGHAESMEISEDPLAEAYRQYESSHEIPADFAPLLRFLVMNDRRSALLSLLRDAESKPVEMRVNFYRSRLEFPDLSKEVRMPPLSFALYNLYLQHEDGFRNKDRFALKQLAGDFYRRLRSTDAGRAGTDAMDACFDVRDDAPFRDAIYKANRAIEHVLGKNAFSHWYTIRGERGGKRKIELPRHLVVGV
jgi:hypothetical protein